VNSDVRNAERQSASRTQKFSKDSANNVSMRKMMAEPIKPLDLDLINEVNADIRATERLLETNLEIKKENDANRESLRNTLMILKEKRRRTIFG
jgi:hypothetical protein